MSDENPASSDPVLPGRQKKKRVHKPGGSFCAFGGCSNRSERNKTPASQHPGRKFLKFYKLPADPIRRKAWVARMKRDLKWKPSNYTKICSDHFSVSDFSEADLAKWEDSVPGTKPSIIRLKPDAIPNTDRVTGNAVDLLQPENPFKVRRGPPRERNSEPGSSTYNRLILASTIKSETARQQYLSKEFTNRLKRHLAYRTYLVIVNNSCPLGRYNRVVIPRCVVSKIREKYPEVSDSLYTGFLDVQNNAAQSASSTTE